MTIVLEVEFTESNRGLNRGLASLGAPRFTLIFAAESVSCSPTTNTAVRATRLPKRQNSLDDPNESTAFLYLMLLQD